VVVVGGGNSGAQIVADLFEHAEVTWATRSPPSFLPDDIDGRYLFGEESARYRALTNGVAAPPRTLGDIVAVESVPPGPRARRARRGPDVHAIHRRRRRVAGWPTHAARMR
jgi:cation diffusion facilitator CzcD-associated flavoprotein CzcO